MRLRQGPPRRRRETEKRYHYDLIFWRRLGPVYLMFEAPRKSDCLGEPTGRTSLDGVARMVSKDWDGVPANDCYRS